MFPMVLVLLLWKDLELLLLSLLLLPMLLLPPLLLPPVLLLLPVLLLPTLLLLWNDSRPVFYGPSRLKNGMIEVVQRERDLVQRPATFLSSKSSRRWMSRVP